MFYLNVINKKINKKSNHIRILDYKTGNLSLIDDQAILDILEIFLKNNGIIYDKEDIKNLSEEHFEKLLKEDIIKEFKYYNNKVQKNVDFISRLSVDGRILYNYKNDETFIINNIEDIIWNNVGYGKTVSEVIDQIINRYKNINKLLLIDYANNMTKNFLLYTIFPSDNLILDNPFANRQIIINKKIVNYKREFSDAMILFARNNGRIIILNNYFARLIELIESEILLFDLIKILDFEFGLNIYSINDIIDFILYFNQEGFILIDNFEKSNTNIKIENNSNLLVNWHNTLNNQKNIENFLLYSTSPWFVVCEVNYECNFRCRTCYASDYEEKENNSERGELSIEEYKKLIIDQLYEEKVFHLTFMGGEPFLRKDFKEIYSYAVNKGFYVKIQTNGSMITDSIAKDLIESKVQQVEVSLDGINAETNDIIRGKGTFEKAIQGLRILKKYNIPRVGICFTVTKQSVEQIEKVVDFAKDEGIDEIFFSIYAPMSCNDNLNKELKLSDKENSETISKIRELQEKNRNMVIFAITDCEAARRVCVIGPSGDIRPCTLHSNVAGNLKEKSFRDIWFYSQTFREIRWPFLFKSECNHCNNKHFCSQTFCSAKEYQLSGNMLSKECILI